ncbi:hypothetical protein CPXG_00054 [Cyanophage P-RSM6]|uniref:hypothetical protein n=1 Tax=Cyanophage P-RSM6 TaxID=929832 RepID=UPI0002C180CC|nr:hypothetical protein CPXG_00054 [Cyanophage P-RSM6]AGH56857.1 hypothetical protein CPXG_00054 [Cyanophage P-RSM6]|tara:strand:+ start:314 stop:625 length:312 start_codon:yes stop_codon:yes gene_type:complete
MRSSDIDLQIDPTPTPPNPIPGTEVHLTPGLYPEGTDGSTFNIEYSDPQHVQIIDAVAELNRKLDHALEHLHKIESMAHPKPTGATQQRNEDRLTALEKEVGI